MKKYKVTVHYRYINGAGEIEKDFDTEEIEALTVEHAKMLASRSYGSKYAIFKFECVEVLTRQKMFNLTNPVNNADKL